VLTHNSPETLSRCLEALEAQGRPPDEIVVVDNASTEPVPRRPGIALLRSDVNTGPAGGHHLAISHFLETDHDYVWVMDDDIVPEPDCLELLLTEQMRQSGSGLVRPVARTGAVVSTAPGWCGVLIAREAVEEVGLPRADLFWWMEDTEYLQHRIGRSRFGDFVCADASVEHLQARDRASPSTPPWKYYYQSRNAVWYRTRVYWGQPLSGLRRLIRAIFVPPSHIIFRDHGDYYEKLCMHVRGVYDGCLGRLGRRSFPS
jgi:GT2 family glycosyltransferase